jgi:hypothetical protein
MASSWGIASFSDVSPDMEVELSFSPSHGGSYSWDTNIVSATVRTSPGCESISALNRENSGARSIWDQSAARGVQDLIMASAARTVDASNGTFNEVGGNQIYNITNNIALATIGDRCKLRIDTSMDDFNIPEASLAHTPRNTYSGLEIGADEPQTSMIGVISEEPGSVMHSSVC